MRKFLMLLPTVALLAACATPTAHLPSTPEPVSWPATGNSVQPQAKAWWTQGADPMLLGILAAAEQNSHEVKIAVARLKEARAAHVTARSLLFPDISAAGVTQRGDIGLTYSYRTIDITQGELDASYDLDLFGGRKSQLKAAGAVSQSAQASLEDVRGAVRLEIIASYIGLRQCQQDLVSMRTTAASAHEIAASFEQQWHGGLITEGQWRASEMQARSVGAGVSRLNEACEQYINAISVLAGDDRMMLRSPLSTTAQIPEFTHADQIDAPLSILRQRPDMRAAEATLTAARAATRSAQAALFPDLSIRAFYGTQDSSVRPSVDVWNTAATLYWPLLNFGRIKSQIDGASAREVQAYEDYRLTAIAALADVRTKLTAVDEAEDRHAFAQADFEAAARQHDEATRQYNVGLIPKTALLASTIQYEASHRALTGAKADQSIKAAALYRAEGQ